MKIEVKVDKHRKPDYYCLSIELLEEIRKFFRDPENEREFQEWQKQRQQEQ